MLTEQTSPTSSEERFRALCSELEDYEHLPELMPGNQSMRLITDQSHEDSIDGSILAGLTHP
jgi:hypothetical protein